MGNDYVPPKTANWEPGTLDKTRKNIGRIDDAEAKKMVHTLGGEIMRERSHTHTAAQSKSRRGPIRRPTANSTTSSSELLTPKTIRREELPPITHQVNNLIDKLMMSSEYRIKRDYGLFNFIRRFKKNGTECVMPEFVEVTLKQHMSNMEAFITDIKTLIQIAPNTYKAKIVASQEPKFKFLRMVAEWTMQSIKLSYINLTALKEPPITADLIPFVRAIYRPLVSIYYYGENKIPKLIKEIYADQLVYPDASKERLSDLAKESITQWLYISTEIIHKLYPLLMRMSTSTYEEYPAFFTTNIADILKFVGLHKFDLLLPEKPKAETKPAEKPAPVRETRGERDEVVNTGIALLDQLFPQAGFKQLDTHPDLFSYFQPLYQFAEGFNVLSPQNPLQVTIVLVRIIEDCFRGSRTITFSAPNPDESGKDSSDSMNKIIDDWNAYWEHLFEKSYCEPLINFVNEIYVKPEFAHSPVGKKTLDSLLWQMRNHFLPHFTFEQLTLEHPVGENKYPPLFVRTSFARKFLTEAMRECDQAAHARRPVTLLKNPWEHYHFDIPNEISKRFDVLLGAQNTGQSTNATNANLLKYTLCIIAVLDWWINNPSSPAYSSDPMDIYRVSLDDGKPQFSTEVRNDQNKLFAETIKAAYKKR
ncbi:MAG: hypothetical protein IJ191_06445 [Treponema sp.]|nr:hypothetical protein [Treponema sp.]